MQRLLVTTVILALSLGPGATAAADEDGLEGASLGGDIGAEKWGGGEGGSGKGGIADEGTSGQWVVHGMGIKTEGLSDF